MAKRKTNVGEVAIENARIIFKNFAGKESTYNRAGARNFCVILDDEEIVKQMMDDGWNIKTLASRDEDEEPAHYIQVSVNFENRPPNVYLITKKNKVLLNERTIDSLDNSDIAYADLIISPYFWEVRGETGVKAYLKTMYVTVNEDVFAHKYESNDIPEPDDDDDLPF